MISESQQDQASLYAFGALDADEAALFERDMHSNAELRDLVRELRDAAASIALTAPARAVPPGLRDKVLSQIALEQQAGETSRIAPSRSWLPWAIAALLALSCGALLLDRARIGRELFAVRDNFRRSAAALGTMQEELRVANDKLQATRGQLEVSNQNGATTQAELDALRKGEPFSGATLYSLAPTPGGPKGAQATVVWHSDRQAGLIKIANLPAPQSGRDYQLWAVDANHKAPVSAGVVHVDNKGQAEIRFRPTQDTKAVKAFAISVENQGGSPTKKGPIILVGTS